MKDGLSIDQMIWERSAGWRRTNEEWSAIVSHLVETVSTYLEQKVELLESSVIDGEALCCSIRSASTFGGPLVLAWEGRLGMELIDSQPYVSAFLFLFSQNRRLAVVGQSGSYLALTYRLNDNGVACWHSDGWQEDVYGEFESIDEYLG